MVRCIHRPSRCCRCQLHNAHPPALHLLYHCLQIPHLLGWHIPLLPRHIQTICRPIVHYMGYFPIYSLFKLPHPCSGSGTPIILSRTPRESSSWGSGRHLVLLSVYFYASLLVRRLKLISTVTYLSCSSRLLRLARLPDLTFLVLPIPPLGLLTS
jgi:hypothetical protein